ncbi:hypothetical protein SB778_30965, partial [Paraburkholderia sp. SIMBA_050]
STGSAETRRLTSPAINRPYTRLDLISQAVANTLNARPRKTLGWKTPAETLDAYLKSVQHSSVATTG